MHALPLRTAAAAALLALHLSAGAIQGPTGTSTGLGHIGLYGVQVSANWVLTAHHVGWAAGATYDNAYGSAQVAQVFHASNRPFPQDDLTLLRLASPINAPVLGLLDTVLPFGVLAQPLDATIVRGFDNPQAPRQYGHTRVREVAALADPDDDAGPRGLEPVNWLLTYNDSYSTPHVFPGDSGGGLLLGHVTDSVGGTLAGITAAVNIHTWRNPGRTEYESGFVQLAAYRSWIDGVLAADGHDNQAITWRRLDAAQPGQLAPVPELPPAVLLPLGLALLAGLRRLPSQPAAG